MVQATSHLYQQRNNDALYSSLSVRRWGSCGLPLVKAKVVPAQGERSAIKPKCIRSSFSQCQYSHPRAFPWWWLNLQHPPGFLTGRGLRADLGPNCVTTSPDHVIIWHQTLTTLSGAHGSNTNKQHSQGFISTQPHTYNGSCWFCVHHLSAHKAPVRRILHVLGKQADRKGYQ
jgi:hypothetical protein